MTKTTGVFGNIAADFVKKKRSIYLKINLSPQLSCTIQLAKFCLGGTGYYNQL